MKNTLIAVGFSVFLLGGCKNAAPHYLANNEDTDEEASEAMSPDQLELVEEEDQTLLVSEDPLPATVDELFDDFFFNFATNRQLQMERIQFPLIVNSGAKKDTLERDDWQMEHFFMHEGEYTLIFDSQEQMEQVKDTALNDAIVEKIFLENEYIRQYIFSRRQGKWMLCEVRNQTLPRNPNASFIDFYHHFVTDSVFQVESLSDEIAFAGPDPDDDFTQMEGVITPDSWEAFAPELPQRMLFNIVYGRQDSTANEKILVLRGIANGEELELTFHRNHGRWRLTRLTE